MRTKLSVFICADFIFKWRSAVVDWGKRLENVLQTAEDEGENMDEDDIKKLYYELDIMLIQAITNAGVSGDPFVIIESLKHSFAEKPLNELSQNMTGQVAEEQNENKAEIEEAVSVIQIESSENSQNVQNEIPKLEKLVTSGTPIVDLILDENVKNEQEMFKNMASLLEFKNTFSAKVDRLIQKVNSLDVSLEKNYLTSGQVKTKLDVREVPLDFDEKSYSLFLANTHSVTSDIFSLLGWLDPGNKIELRKSWWDTNINKTFSVSKAAFLSRQVMFLISELNLAWINNISLKTLENYYMKVKAVRELLITLKFEKWAKFEQVEKALKILPNSASIKNVKMALMKLNAFDYDFSTLILDEQHLKDFEANEIQVLENWDNIKFRVNLKGFKDSYVSIFPDQGDNELEELDSKMSDLGVSQTDHIQEQTIKSLISEDDQSGNSSESDYEPVKKLKKANYCASEYTSFLDELNKLTN